MLHVNTFDPDSLTRACKFAVRYWQRFQKDILLDMIGFRKYGHNEIDEPSFTQPRMYDVIRNKKSVAP